MVWMSPGPKAIWDILVHFYHPFRSSSAAGVVLQKHSVLLGRKHLKYNCLSLPALTPTDRKSGCRILEDSALELSARTAGQPVHVWLSVTLTCRACVHAPIPEVASAWIISLLPSLPEHPILWHALVMWAPHYGVDQCFRHAHHPAAAFQILWLAA